MDVINAIIVMRQSAHEMSPSYAMRKAMAISLEATRQPCRQTQQRHCEYHDNTHPKTAIIVTRASISVMQAQQTQHKCNKHDHELGGPLNREPWADWENSCPRSTMMSVGSITKHATKDLQAKTKQHKAIMTCTPCVTHATIAGQAVMMICLAMPASPSPVSTEQT
jgi:hypothetical protein